MRPNRQKQLLFEKQAEIAKAIAQPLRIAVLEFLRDGERCVCDIAEYVGAERSNVSRHCSVIVFAGTFTEVVQRYMNWTEKSKGAVILKRICGLLVIAGGLYLIYIS